MRLCKQPEELIILYNQSTMDESQSVDFSIFSMFFNYFNFIHMVMMDTVI